MNTPHARLDELFVRYWDNVLTPDETDELACLLMGDPVAVEWFQMLSAQAVAAAELLTPHTLSPDFLSSGLDARASSSSHHLTASPRWSRRRMLGVIGGGLAAGLSAIVLGRSFWKREDNTDSAVRLRILKMEGTVTVRTGEGQTLPADGTVPTGSTIATEGYSSTATLLYPDGSTVSVLGDSALTVHESGRLLLLRQGIASAELRPRDYDQRLTFTTALLTLARVDDTSITVGQDRQSTEIEVYHGAVSVSAPTGKPMTVVREGELLTVGANGVHTIQPMPTPPNEFSWDITAPLPEGWGVGRREVVNGTPVIHCEAWPDPYYHGTVMHQIRSNQPWGRGLFQLIENSTIHIRYRANLASPKGQFCFCVRTTDSRRSETGMLEYNGGFEASKPGEWRWLHISVAEMLANKHTPAFGSPWVAFLVIFNTFEPDVGLEIADFRVTPPAS